MGELISARANRLDPARVDEIRDVLALYVDRLHDVDFMKPHAQEALDAVTSAGSQVSPDHARLVLRVLMDFDRRMRELDDAHQPLVGSDAGGRAARRVADVEGYVVLDIPSTDNAAFSDVGRDAEVARIIKEASGRAWREDFASLDVPLRDLNGNRVGSMTFGGQPPAGPVPDGGVRLVVKTSVDVDEDDPGTNVSVVMMEIAHRIERGEHAFAIRDASGEAARVQMRDGPSNDAAIAERARSDVEPG